MSWFGKLTSGLKKSASSLTDGLKKAMVGKRLDNETCDALEEVLIQSDLGTRLSLELVEKLRQEKFTEEITYTDVVALLEKEINRHLEPVTKELTLPNAKPAVVLMVGVNGAGKTTTLGKLAKKYIHDGKKIMLAAADTYRAGAVDQLKTWAERADVPIVTPENEKTDAAALAYQAYAQAIEEQYDILFIDTAGRLQNREDLMAQLEKMVRVLKKLNPEAPHASLLVLDATVGQNAYAQVETFQRVAAVSGLIMTKLDSTAKGGVVVGLAKEFKLPIHFIGVGEGIDDLQPFKADDFAKALLQDTTS